MELRGPYMPSVVMPHFTDKKLKPREEKGYFFDLEQEVAIGEVGTGPQSLLDTFTSSVLCEGTLGGNALGRVSLFSESC